MPIQKITSGIIQDGAVAAADIVSVANTAITGLITASQIAAVNGSVITANTIANSAIQTGAVENYMNATGLSFGMRNRIINGAMVIAQRGTSAVNTNVSYPVDRFRLVVSNSSKVSLQQSSTVPTGAGFVNSIIATSLAATTVGAGDTYEVDQQIEGYNIADLMWGTANAKTVTLSFWVRSSLTGTFGGALESQSNARAYPFSYTISSANTWEQKKITIAGDTTGTWVTDNSRGVVIRWSLGTGSTYLNTANAWVAGDYQSVTGETKLVATNGATWYITGTQFEVGSTATSFDYRPYGTELALCQRYFETSADFGNNAQYDGQQIVVGVGGTTFGGAVAFCQGKPFSVRKRTAPTVVMYYQDGSAGNVYRIDNAAKIAAVALYLNPAGFLYTYSSTSAFNQGYGYYYSFTADAEL
jgi:hypothetical protein